MRRRRLGRRLLGALLLVVLLELALQAAAPLVQRAMSRHDEVAASDAALSVLCVGDSNTYGLHLPQVFAYPAQLQARLAVRYTRPVSVSNRGVPGQNSAQVAAALSQDLRDTHPDVVLVLAGINDTWNTDAESQGLSGLLGRLRLVRLARVLLAGVTTEGRFEVRSDADGQIVVDRGRGEQRVNAGEGRTGVRSGEALAASVRAGLRRALELCRDHGAVPVLMTYPEFQGDFATVNAAARALAVDERVLLVDHERDFQGHFAREGYATLMFGDHHPNLRGYQLMADGIDAALAAAGLLPPRLPGATESAAARVPDRAPAVAATTGGKLGLSGPALWPFQVVVARGRADSGGLLIGGTRIPLPDDDLLALSRLEPTFSGRLDAQGRAEVTVPARLREAVGPGGAWACLILLNEARPGDDADHAVTPVAAASEAVAVVF
jgi:lysophospholipase L1-like esterase